MNKLIDLIAAKIGYLDDTGAKHEWQISIEALDSILKEFNGVTKYFDSLGVHYVTCFCNDYFENEKGTGYWNPKNIEVAQ